MSLPPLPLSDEVLDHIIHALGGSLTYEGENGERLDEPRRVGAEFGLSRLLDLLAGHDPENSALTGYANDIPVYECFDPTYSEHDLIAALVVEVRRLRLTGGES